MFIVITISSLLFEIFKDLVYVKEKTSIIPLYKIDQMKNLKFPVPFKTYSAKEC